MVKILGNRMQRTTKSPAPLSAIAATPLIQPVPNRTDSPSTLLNCRTSSLLSAPSECVWLFFSIIELPCFFKSGRYTRQRCDDLFQKTKESECLKPSIAESVGNAVMARVRQLVMACMFFFGKDQSRFLEDLNPSRGLRHVRPLVNLIRWDRENAKGHSECQRENARGRMDRYPIETQKHRD